MNSSAQWYFTHETAEDRIWYQIFFSMCKKFGVSWAQADAAQKAFIEEITRFNFESEMAKKNGVSEPIRGFFDDTVSA